MSDGGKARGWPGRWYALILGAMTMAGWACSTGGPVEVLETHGLEDGGDCEEVEACRQESAQALAEGRFEESRHIRLGLCRDGSVKGCRDLADGLVSGAYGDRDEALGKELYQWGCEERGDAASCHRRGELERRTGAYEASETWFARACERDSMQGCHDGVLVRLAVESVDEDTQAKAREELVGLCDRGLDVACVNLGHMEAAGWGGGREHNRAIERFRDACEEPDVAQASALGSPVRGEEPDLYAAAEYHPEVACDHWETLAVGRVEERVSSAMAAERESLRECVEEEESLEPKRIFMRADVGPRGESWRPELEDDATVTAGVATCLETILSRHLDDGDEEGRFKAQWGLSILVSDAAPDDQEGDGETGCDGRALQHVMSQVRPEFHRCGQRHGAEASHDPGATLVRVVIDSEGHVDEVSQQTTFGSTELTTCVERAVKAADWADAGTRSCDFEVPVNFGTRGQLHFSIVVRTALDR